MSSGWYVPGDRQLHSTYLVCRKAQKLNRDQADHQALIKRVRYEFRQSVLSGNYVEADLFLLLLKELNGVGTGDTILTLARNLRMPLTGLRRWYHRLRYS